MKKKPNGWYVTDHAGLRKLVARKGKTFVIRELIRNSWDIDTKLVTVTLDRLLGKPLAHLTVADNNPTKRSQFNLGEKLVLAICKSARIVSAKGTTIFNEDETRTHSKAQRKKGTEFSVIIEMTKAEYKEVCDSIHQLAPPSSISTVFNGKKLLNKPELFA